MTLDQIDQMVRQANPVPDLNVLEPVDASVLMLDQRRRTEMQTHDRIEVDQAPQNPRRGFLIGIAAVAAIVVGVLVFLRPLDDAPVVAEQPATEIATAFVEALGASDVDRAASFLAADANLSEFAGSVDGMRLRARWDGATGFKMLLDSCAATGSRPSGTTVRCTYDYHGIRSEEIGLGPYSGSWLDLTVLDGKIVSVSDHIEFTLNDFSSEVWEPFDEWVSAAYPEDAAIMYTDGLHQLQQLTDESIALWEKASREYVEVVASEAEAEGIASAFVEAFGASDANDRAFSYLAADANLSRFNGNTEGMRLAATWNRATGFKMLLDSCAATGSRPSGTTVRCTYDYHGIRSEEIGLGPYSGSWLDLTVLDGKIVSVSDHIEFTLNDFSSEVWEPFATWVAETYPEDVTIMYTNSFQTMQRYTDESIALWEQRTREYVEVAKG